jgi:hypothetical protein
VSPVASRSPELGWVLPQVCPRRLHGDSPRSREFSPMFSNGWLVLASRRLGLGNRWLMLADGRLILADGRLMLADSPGSLAGEPNWHGLESLKGAFVSSW